MNVPIEIKGKTKKELEESCVRYNKEIEKTLNSLKAPSIFTNLINFFKKQIDKINQTR